MGAEHGNYCVGCCGGLMVVLFALGVMSLFWMAVVAGVIFVQKLAPAADRAAPVFAALLAGLGIWVAAAPGSVPGLTQPDSPGANQARMRMMNEPARPMQQGGMKQGGGMTKQAPMRKQPTMMGSQR
jgi:hypothetical protein